MQRQLFMAIEQNMKKKVKSITEDQFIEIIEASHEFQTLSA